MTQERPIFVRGVSRSGGTLVVTLLDTHPRIAMSYELYTGLFEDAEKRAFTPKQLISRINADKRTFLRKKLVGNAKVLVARARRGALDSNDISRLLVEHERMGLDFLNTDGRLRFIAACCRVKQERKHACVWGLKCSNDFEAYHALWPDAAFVNVVRDGRDVLASQLVTGRFDPKPTDLGRSWANTHRRFLEFSSRKDTRGHVIIYEDLVKNPEPVIRSLCEFLDVEFVPKMLNFHAEKLTVFDANHLSIDRITKPIDATKVGRYKKELTDGQRQAFEESGRDMMKHFGYL